MTPRKSNEAAADAAGLQGDVGLHGDFGLLSPVSASPLVAALTGDRAVLAAILRVEAAWATVLEGASLAPAGSAAVVAAAADVSRYDLADLAVRAQGGANPVIPLLADLRGQVAALDTAGIGAGQAVHTSLTSQDVLDSALILLARDAVRGLLTELKAATAALAALAEQHADTLCVGRSLTQHSLPFSFGLKAAQWFHGLAAAARRLEALEFPVQTGGAAGTLAAGTVLTAGSGLSPFDLSDRLAAELGLAAVPAPWHTNRLAVTSLGDALAAVTDAAGKIASDVLFLSRPEVAELAEPRAAGRAGPRPCRRSRTRCCPCWSAAPPCRPPARPPSCTWPPPTSTMNAPTAPGTANGRPSASSSAWASEPPSSCGNLPKACRSSPGPCGATWTLPDRCCSVKPSRPPSHRSWRTARGRTVRGRRSVGAADGKRLLQSVVDQTLQVPAAEQAATYRRLLRDAVPPAVLSDARLEELLDPANYLGQAADISRCILAAYPDYNTGAGHSGTGAAAGVHTPLPIPDLNGASRG